MGEDRKADEKFLTDAMIEVVAGRNRQDRWKKDHGRGRKREHTIICGSLCIVKNIPEHQRSGI